MDSTTSLGKRKERDPNDAQHGSTLFVSNLPYSATSTDLQTLFSDIAPVRSAFVVLDHESKVSKGVGYVSFAVKEDAQMAYDEIQKDGLKLVNRALRVQWAENKPKDGEEPKKPSKAPKVPSHPKGPHDPDAVRTLVVSGLPSGVEQKVLWKKFRKFEGAIDVKWPVPSEDGKEDSTIAHVLFSKPNLALDAMPRLHAHVYKGSILSVALKKRLEVLSRHSTSKKSSAPNHNSRLIIRNLPFDITEQDLRAVFLPFGPVHSIHIPTSQVEDEEGNTQTRTKGFAFVWMLSRKDAEKALEGCNGKPIKAGSAQQMVLDKQKKKKLIRLHKKMKDGEVKKEEDEDVELPAQEEGEADVEEVEAPKAANERVMAVDWALSKDKWNEEKAKMEVDGEDDDEASVKEDDDDDDSDSDSSSDSDSDTSGSGNEALGVHERDTDDEDEEPVKPELPPPATGTTLFVRNVPYEATEDELRTLFRTFGPLRYARITVDPETGRSRGTGFACFWNIEDADKVVEQSDLLRAQTTAPSDQQAKKAAPNPFKLPSILTPDPSSSLAQSLVLHGRTLDAVRAVTRDQAGKLKEEGERRREKADKRNMYLLREGVILPNSPAAQSITPGELEKRTNSYNARRQLLKTNPALYVSKTRLSIRQVPTFVTERMLRKLANHSLKSFRDEVKAGKRKELSKEELLEDVADSEPKPSTGKPAATEDDDANSDNDGDEDGESKDKAKTKRSKAWKKTSGVKQAKLVRMQERIDPITLKGKSKGYGFLEMFKHADSLRVLRWSNNNPDVGSLFEQWWKDDLKLMIKSETDKLKERKKGKLADGDDEEAETRLSRMKQEMEAGANRKAGKGALIVEFSIENVQVVQRRHTRDENSRKRQPKDGQDEERPSKKAKTSKTKPVPATASPVKKEESVQPANPLGSLIGRKRKQRQAKHGKR